MSVSALCPPAEDEVRVEGDLDAAVALITVCGAWAGVLPTAATAAVRKCLAAHPEALIVDLSGLHDPVSGSTETWTEARRAAAAMDPPVQLALCVPPDRPLARRLQHRSDRPYLPVYAKLRQARVAVTGRMPVTDRRSLVLPPEPDSPSVARDMVGAACLSWGRPELLPAARLVMSELVTNGVEHTGDTLTAAVTRRGTSLQLTVSDCRADPPRLIQPARPRPGRPLDERGLGLRLVAGTSRAWGWLPTATGKVVWAVIGPR